MRGRFGSTVLVILVPILLLALIGLATGSLDIGTPELAILMVIWVVGLVWVWRPRQRKPDVTA
jgi:hypothetical protein